MYGLMCLILLFAAGGHAQDANDARALIQRAESLARTPKSWRAEIVETIQISGNGIAMESKVHTKIAALAPLKMRRENSEGDQTLLVCDGAESFYSGDGHSYYRNPAKTNQDCDFPLRVSYLLEKDLASISIVGRDHVLLEDGNHVCDVVRAEARVAEARWIRTMCIDPKSGLILKDVTESNREGLRLVTTATFTSYEINPTFLPDTFRFSPPPGAVEAKSPI